MKIKLTKEQVELIANEVAGLLSNGKTSRTAPKRRPCRITNVVVPPPDIASVEFADTDESLLLTIRADLAAIVQAINGGSQKHSLELAEHLLWHVEEVLAER